jgi:DNA ligase-1
MTLPTLYKRTSTGAIEQWSIEVVGAAQTWKIVTTYGHVGGKLQQAEEIVRQGKNLGKKNETTSKEQAEAQARSEWQMKLSRKGYVEKLEDAEAGKNAGAGGIRPMLAKAFEDCEKKFMYPCYAQPKLDGIRCVAVVEDTGCVTLWTREQKPIVAVPRIAQAVADLGLSPGTVLDGELYNHDLKDDFEKIVSCVRKQYPASEEEQALIQYHVYDLPRVPGFGDLGFGDRWDHMAKCIDLDNEVIKRVETRTFGCREALIDYRKHCQGLGYEGAMARADEPYAEGKRSGSLLKLKEFLDDDFEIVGVNEGVGKMAGLAIFECRAANGNTFAVKMEGELEGLRKYLVDESTWKGKKLTVKYFSLTNKNKVPRFPVGKSVRDYE